MAPRHGRHEIAPESFPDAVDEDAIRSKRGSKEPEGSVGAGSFGSNYHPGVEHSLPKQPLSRHRDIRRLTKD